MRKVLYTLGLLLPVLIPSWRFFDRITPSPRIEFALLKTARSKPRAWQEFRPRPSTLSFLHMLQRMFWNPRWNESLFLVSCAERLVQNPTEHSRAEILKRLMAELQRKGTNKTATPYVQFRLVFVNRSGTRLQKEVVYISPAHPFGEGSVS